MKSHFFHAVGKKENDPFVVNGLFLSAGEKIGQNYQYHCLKA